MRDEKNIASHTASVYEEVINRQWGILMLQENIFFSTPFIFFGEHCNEDEMEEEENFSDLWNISLHANQTNQPLPRIGLFIHWTDLSG